MKMTKALASLAVLAIFGTSAARADQKNFFYRCSPGALRACASIQVQTTLNISGGTNVIIRVRNMQGGPSWMGDNTGGSVITRIGLVAPAITGSSVTNGALTVTAVGAGASQTGGAAGLWFLRDPGSLGAPIELTAGVAQGSNLGGIVGCSAPSGGNPSVRFNTCNTNVGWIEFSFSTSNAWSAYDSEVAWLPRATANGNKTLECGSNFSGNNGMPRDWCTGVTPEPVTMVLLGSGLAGMSGFGFFRRRKNTEIENG